MSEDRSRTADYRRFVNSTAAKIVGAATAAGYEIHVREIYDDAEALAEEGWRRGHFRSIDKESGEEYLARLERQFTAVAAKLKAAGRELPEVPDGG